MTANRTDGRTVKAEDKAASGRGIARAEIVSQICDRIIAGESVASIWRSEEPPSISWRTFYRWLADDSDLAAQVAKAEEQACAALHDRMVDVAREPRIGEIVTSGTRDGKPFEETRYVDAVERSKLEVHALQWTLARRMPKKYGDKLTLAGDADNPIAITDARAALAAAIAGRHSGNAPGVTEERADPSDSKPDE